MIQSDLEERRFAGLIPSWHHVQCFLERLEELEAVGVSAAELSGYVKLKEEDREELAGQFEAKSGKKGKAAAG